MGETWVEVSYQWPLLELDRDSRSNTGENLNKLRYSWSSIADKDGENSPIQSSNGISHLIVQERCLSWHFEGVIYHLLNFCLGQEHFPLVEAKPNSQELNVLDTPVSDFLRFSLKSIKCSLKSIKSNVLRKRDWW